MFQKKRKSANDIAGGRAEVVQGAAALRSAGLCRYLAGGLRLFGAFDLWQPGREENTVCNSATHSQCGNVERAAAARVNLLQVFEQSSAQVLADVLRYQTVSEAQEVVCVGGEQQQSSCRFENMQYCCHLLASHGTANAGQSNESNELTGNYSPSL